MGSSYHCARINGFSFCWEGHQTPKMTGNRGFDGRSGLLNSLSMLRWKLTRISELAFGEGRSLDRSEGCAPTLVLQKRNFFEIFLRFKFFFFFFFSPQKNDAVK